MVFSFVFIFKWAQVYFIIAHIQQIDRKNEEILHLLTFKKLANAEEHHLIILFSEQSNLYCTASPS